MKSFASQRSVAFVVRSSAHPHRDLLPQHLWARGQGVVETAWWLSALPIHSNRPPPPRLGTYSNTIVEWRLHPQGQQDEYNRSV